MKTLGIDHNGEEVDELALYFGKKNLSGIKWKCEKPRKDVELGAEVRDKNGEINWA